ncbi:DNA-binding transcriptional LysR family regulator [Hydrogenophaga palleronii]|uniref:DNA-binding transcriptional LysR family regulator n=1 Tax=Hydrogenophaga palleronii TaxID=65655 RepID=A0ABU1WQU8_9BURK|nr:LysR family transcriptional regulator [Hydrogenophaga palleronii]MDR7151336.1 DNA-binding transcriptional LysR family regulator [Hydrogenophaga palleronii]
MDQRIGWELYRSLLAVLEEGSLSGAARTLGLTQPTVGRHVALLEAALGTTLFMRSQTGLQPTEAALALRDGAEAMHSMAASLERSARSLGEGVRGTVRISASEVMGVEVLPPMLAALHAKHPDLRVELVTSNALQDLVRREVDIAVRMTPPKQEVLLATRVGDVEVGLHAHRSYLERHGKPTSMADLAHHVLIGFDRETPFLRSATAKLPIWQRENFHWRCDSDLAQLALLRAGAGIGGCQTALARRDPNLVRVLPTRLALKLTTWVAMHEGLRNSPRCRVVFDGLVKGLRGYVK